MLYPYRIYSASHADNPIDENQRKIRSLFSREWQFKANQSGNSDEMELN